MRKERETVVANALIGIPSLTCDQRNELQLKPAARRMRAGASKAAEAAQGEKG